MGLYRDKKGSKKNTKTRVKASCLQFDTIINFFF